MDKTQFPDSHQDTPTRARHAVPGQASEVFSPLGSEGQAGLGAADLADRIARAHEKAPSAGRDFAARAYAMGAVGEEAVAEHLRWLNGEQFFVLHDQPWPGRPKANIDHVVVGITGIFVVDAKNWSGEITVSDQVLRQNGRFRGKAVDNVRDQAEAVTTLFRSLGAGYPSHIPITPVLAFTSDEVGLQSISEVGVVCARSIAEYIGDRPQVIPTEQIKQIAMTLKDALELDRSLELTNLREAQARGRAEARMSRATSAQQFAAPSASSRRGGPAPDSRKAASSRPASPSKSTSSSRRSRKKSAGLWKVLVLFGIAYVAIQNPELIGSIATKLGDFIGGLMTSGVQSN